MPSVRVIFHNNISCSVMPSVQVIFHKIISCSVMPSIRVIFHNITSCSIMPSVRVIFHNIISCSVMLSVRVIFHNIFSCSVMPSVGSKLHDNISCSIIHFYHLNSCSYLFYIFFLVGGVMLRHLFNLNMEAKSFFYDCPNKKLSVYFFLHQVFKKLFNYNNILKFPNNPAGLSLDVPVLL